MKTLRLYGNAINHAYISATVDALRDGAVIIYPTDTLYAIGCDLLNTAAVRRLCRIKDLDPERSNLSLCCASISQASTYARIDNNAFAILRSHLPGPYTFILPTAPGPMPKLLRHRKQIGIRVPDDPVATAIARELGNPLLTTSISLDHIIDIDTADDDTARIATLEIADTYASQVDILLDAGTRGASPSTVVDITDPGSPILIRAAGRDL